MSGFFGVIHFDGSPLLQEHLERMLVRLRWRGRTKQALVHNDHVAFGHTLLITTYASVNEIQPLTFKHVTLVTDARLVGRDQLITELNASPTANATAANLPLVSYASPDSELLLRAYLRWGDAFLDHIKGEFALGLWDEQRQTAILARDQLGINHMFYAVVRNTLVFSNDLEAIRRYPEVPDVLDDQAVGGFLILGGHRWLDKTATIYRNIRAISNAHRVTVTAEGVRVSQYWTLNPDPLLLRNASIAEYVEQYRALLKTAVKERIETDSVVVLLSGGMDSTAIAALAAQLVKEGTVNTQLYLLTSVYETVHPDTEAFYARTLAHAYDLPHYIFCNDPYRIEDPVVVYAQPTHSITPRATIDYWRLIASHAPIALSGAGSDEILHPTPLIDVLGELPLREAVDLYEWLWRFHGKRPPFGGLKNWLMRRFLKRDVDYESQPGYNYPTWLQPDFEAEQHLKESWEWYWKAKRRHYHHWQPGAYWATTAVDWQQDAEFLRDPGFTLTRTSSPFLDLRLVEFAMTLPLFNWRNKKLLHLAMVGILPPEILYRPKTPIGNVTSSLLRQPKLDWLDHWEMHSDLVRYVRRDAVPSVVGHPLEDDPPNQYINLRPMIFNSWLKEHNRYKNEGDTESPD